MLTAYQIKEQAITDTPLLLFDCQFASGAIEHWSSHGVTVNGTSYSSRVLQHHLFDIQTSSDQGVDSIPKISLSLANADSHFSELERTSGFRGATLTVSFIFFDLVGGAPTSAVMTLFQGIVNPPDESTEATFRITAVNRMNMQRVWLPPIRIQRRCPWDFPSNLAQRQEAASGGTEGAYSRYYRCGYSPDVVGGAGNLNGSAPYTSCAFTRSDCEARGMFNSDGANDATRRFGGFEFVPSAIFVRSYGEQGRHSSPIMINVAEYNDFVPLVYGTVWYTPKIIFSRNDGNLTRMEVLLGTGVINSVVKVLVNNIEIPLGKSGANMTGTGWFNVVSTGGRNGGFNPDFTDSSGNPLGDPYGSMATLSVVVPNRISDGQALPTINVLAQGAQLPIYGTDGSPQGQQFTSNPAWILLDVLRRCGWLLEEIDLGSFAAAAAYADQLIQSQDLHGNPISIPRFQCNLAVTARRTAGDLIRAIRNTSRLFLTYGTGGLLQLNVENTMALQQPSKLDWSNTTSQLNGGWPSYEFGDGSAGLSGIARRSNGQSSVRVWSRGITDTPNQLTVEFQDSLNQYQQDSYTLVDVNDAELTGQEVTASLTAVGLPNYDQAARILQYTLDRSILGNTYVEFQTSVKALGLRPGDLITLTYLKEGFNRQPFRVLKLSPDLNYRLVTITAQIHDDAWYDDTNGQINGNTGAGVQPVSEVGLPRPLVGTVVDANGNVQFGTSESVSQATDGSQIVDASVSFTAPATLSAGGPAIPLLSLSPGISATGGTLTGGVSLYYAVSSVTSTGVESALSFLVRATIPAGPNTNSVALSGLSFPLTATAFNVYRGGNPSQIYRIASQQPIAAQFTDTGLAEQTIPPPDSNFDHANFYWRFELVPEYVATMFSATTIGNATLQMPANDYVGAVVRITRGTGAGQEAAVASNTATMLQLSGALDTAPDATSYFVVAESGWRFAASAKSSPVQFEIPNRAGQTIHVSGRAANTADGECPAELCTVTRWAIGGSGGADAAAPPAPVFGLSLAATGGGALVLSGVSFTDLTNTHTITNGTLTIFYWPELNGASPLTLASAMAAQDTVANLTVAGPAQPGSYVQIDQEVAAVTAVLSNGTQYQLTRGVDGSTPAAHATGTAVYQLQKTTQIVPFTSDFFGSPYSGEWSYTVSLPDSRVASAELFVTNAIGAGAIGFLCLTQTVDNGLRTLSGGQYSFQVDGFLAIETGATPDVIVESAHSVRDLYAVLRQAPVGGPVELQINQNGSSYCSLTIADGATVSNSVAGTGLPPLAAAATLSLDITMVGPTNPGADLTVIIRL